MHWFVSHLIYLSLTKPTMQQCFHPISKHLLYRCITPSLLDILFVLKVKVRLFCQFTVVRFDSQIYFCVVVQEKLVE